MWMRNRAVAALLMLVTLAACGTAPATRPVPGSSSRLIAETDVRASTASNVLELVQQMRPGWLIERYQGAGSGRASVYVNRQRMGGPEQLRQIDLGNVREVRFLDPGTATTVLGRGSPFGVIQVITEIAG